MTPNEFEKFKALMTTQEGLAWTAHQNVRWLVEESYEEIFEAVEIDGPDAAIKKALIVVNDILRIMSGVINIDTVDAGHGIGHLRRDYIHALLLSTEKMDPRHLYVGMVAGVLHDILGCSVVDRYDDKRRAIKHAEARALLWSGLAADTKLNPLESCLVYYGVAAHTHLLKETKVTCSDGVERTLTPYVDEDADGPRLMFWLPRQIDRLDANGACFIGRHYLTLARDHSDIDSNGGYYKIRFESHMRPLLRGEDEIRADPEGRTLREHLLMYAESQNNASPYGKYDGEVMRRLRDSYKTRLLRIIQSFDDTCSWSSKVDEKTLERWSEWLATRIEPSTSGKTAAKTLEERFNALPKELQKPCFNGMLETLKQHKEWQEEVQDLLSRFPEGALTAPLIGNIRLRL